MSLEFFTAKDKFEANFKNSLQAGAVGTGIYYLLMPGEQRNSIKYKILGKDSFIKDIKNELYKTDNSIDNDTFLKEAEDSYKRLQKVGNKTIKSLLKFFALMTAGFYAGSIIADEYFFIDRIKKKTRLDQCEKKQINNK